jgi:hypothetical protein
MMRLPVQSPPVLRLTPTILLLNRKDSRVQPQQVEGVARNYTNPDVEHCLKWCAARGRDESECLNRCKHAY